ncbi:GerAB/ArcD/ProY family transporter [Paenibacillus tianjinensis]|uniref:GerAB/ArcD/ProY family transporter n=1 Tax=Paenibacillus tianjinensis TaxID=2810347 RepID=A0ABX7LET8_9BACL|nr:GerAB/ArcD/ProY family transporter [Paenibacillus tianjinensis]QSF46625.1 GerAB/ArcD/ProY family transporter [Paenibacillus tianjinensis]
MGKHTLRVSELVICLSLFEIGSTTLFFMGSEAKQDAWLAMLIGALAGLILLILHLSIYRQEPNLDLFQLFRRYTGKYMGSLLNFMFVAYFAYETSRNLRDLGEVTLLTLLTRTPLWIVSLIAILVVANTVRYGYKVFFLICVILFPGMVVGYTIISILFPATGLLHLEFFLPILENGWMPVFKAAIPEIVSFPFGQVVLFLVFYPHARRAKNLPKAVITVYLLTALALTFLNQLIVLVMGHKLAAFSTLPLLESVQLIRLTEVFERTDALFILLFFLGLGIKMAAFFTGAVIGLERITGVSFKTWVFPMSAVIYGVSFLSPNYTHHIIVGRDITLNTSSPFFQIFLPLVLFIMMKIKRAPDNAA